MIFESFNNRVTVVQQSFNKRSTIV